MNGGTSNFDPTSPGTPALPPEFLGCPEETLLAWIEGELSPSEVSALAERYPGAVPLIASMRRDRANLAANLAANATAPADLAERVLAAVERETLLGLSQGEPLSDSLPISQIPKRKTARQIWFQQAAPRLALAAGLVLVVSAGAIFALRGGQPKGGVPPLAINDQPDVPSPVTERTAAPIRIAAGAAADKAEETLASKDTAVAKAEPAEPANAASSLAIDSNRAIELAAEGRLILRVRNVSTAAAARLSSVRARQSPAWQVRGELPETTLAMLAPPAPVRTVSPRFEVPQIASGLASGERGSVSINPLFLQSSPRVELGPAGPMHSGSVVDVRDDAASIDAARAELSKLLGCDVEFEESAQTISLDAPIATPESVLWWTQQPQSWAKRVRVPLVVELR